MMEENKSENNIQDQSMWQKAASGQNPLPETKKKFPALIFIILVIFIFLISVATYLIINYKTGTPREKKTATKSAQRSFNIDEATKEASTKTSEDNQSKGIKELTDLNDELDQTLTDLESSLTDIGNYQTQDDNMPSL